mgnify:CR=1 FL=1
MGFLEILLENMVGLGEIEYFWGGFFEDDS